MNDYLLFLSIISPFALAAWLLNKKIEDPEQKFQNETLTLLEEDQAKLQASISKLKESVNSLEQAVTALKLASNLKR